ncbi:MAG: hypothetical protein CML36_01200 [Rhodobacteraceae bacterium]|nr:hypothetical protein [Paracoccaceae bacterium]
MLSKRSVFLFTLLVLSLLGCGQKGDLYLQNDVLDSSLSD